MLDMADGMNETKRDQKQIIIKNQKWNLILEITSNGVALLFQIRLLYCICRAKYRAMMQFSLLALKKL